MASNSTPAFGPRDKNCSELLYLTKAFNLNLDDEVCSFTLSDFASKLRVYSSRSPSLLKLGPDAALSPLSTNLTLLVIIVRACLPYF
jgi:hypothetical protein